MRLKDDLLRSRALMCGGRLLGPRGAEMGRMGR